MTVGNGGEVMVDHRNPAWGGLVLAALLVAGLVCLWVGAARAEGGCPFGMTPGPPAGGVVGCIPGGNDGAAPDDQPYYPPAPPPPPDGYGAYATDPDFRQLFWATFYDSHEAAEQAAVEDCDRATGKTCQSLGWFGNQCGAIAITQNGQTINGYATLRREAARQALDACEKAGGNAYTICSLWAPPVCAGPSYSAADNKLAETASPAEIEAMSADIDRRDYWGAIASDGNQIQGGYGMPDRRSAETLALSKCDGCRIVKTFENSCAGLAWPSDNRPVYEIVLDDDPATAKAKAKAQCIGKYGACEAGVRCSGRRYPAPNPEAAAASPAAN